MNHGASWVESDTAQRRGQRDNARLSILSFTHRVLRRGATARAVSHRLGTLRPGPTLACQRGRSKGAALHTWRTQPWRRCYLIGTAPKEQSSQVPYPRRFMTHSSPASPQPKRAKRTWGKQAADDEQRWHSAQFLFGGLVGGTPTVSRATVSQTVGPRVRGPPGFTLRSSRWLWERFLVKQRPHPARSIT